MGGLVYSPEPCTPSLDPVQGSVSHTPLAPKWMSSVWWHAMFSFQRITKYTTKLPETKVESAIKDAFELWTKPSRLTFTQISQGEADISIAFVQGGRPSALELNFTFLG